MPTATEESNCWKKASDVEVTLSEPMLSQVLRASYSCSATAKTARYQG